MMGMVCKEEAFAHYARPPLFSHRRNNFLLERVYKHLDSGNRNTLPQACKFPTPLLHVNVSLPSGARPPIGPPPSAPVHSTQNEGPAEPPAHLFRRQTYVPSRQVRKSS